MPADESLDSGHDLRVTAERERGVHLVLGHGEAQLLESRTLDLERRRDVCERWAAPQGERLRQAGVRASGSPDRRRVLPSADSSLEAGEVELVGPDLGRVAARIRPDAVVSQAPGGGSRRRPGAYGVPARGGSSGHTASISSS